ncbi:armadillo repeat-containing protein 8 [Dorcoceras hygrometricum]|uniref:Armadillo repeat-containing protein 8 n=1 Tax=Dorcoceras hygrometricum TaxID=472368 RepID=A0A2Z7B3T4_9LAMI|nr:armadillo repeat-containing protein 8 [Dorcoceras hygrometricum]
MNLFESMKDEHNFILKLEHYACIVDLLCRAGGIQDSYNFHKKNVPTLENIFCSVKNFSAGHFMSETVVLLLVQLLCNSCMSVQISALRAISNVAVDFKQHKSLFRQSKCVNIWFCFKGVANNSVQVQLGNSPHHRYFHPFYVPLV